MEGLENLFSLKAKQVMTSFDLVAIVQEINELVVGMRLENIYQVSPLTLLLVFYPRRSLVVEAGKCIHFTQYEVEKPSFPSLFCRILRKLLSGGVVHRVQMDDFERVISIEIASKGRTYKLVLEIFGKGNIILVDEKEVILHALSYRRMRDREIIRGNPLKPPPSRGYNPLNVSRHEFEGVRKQQEEIVKAISKLLNIGGLYAEELLLRVNLDKKKKASSLTMEETDKIYDEVLNLISSLTHREPHIVVDDKGRWVNVLPFPLKIYSDCKIKSYPTCNEAADEYFTKLTMEGDSDAYNETVQSIDKQKRILSQQKEYLESFGNSVVEKRSIGDTIYQHLSEVQHLFQQIEAERTKGVAWDKIIAGLKEQKDRGKTPATFVDSVDLGKGTLIIKVDALRLKFDIRKSVAKNASSFYEEAKELETKIEGLRKAIVETESKIERLGKSQLQLKSQKTSPTRMREKAWFEKFHWARSSESFLILGGRDASTNELLIKRHVDANDLVFHSDIAGAPFVVLKTEGKVPSEQTMFEAAELSASYSRGWKEGYTSLDVYWIKPEQVSKQAPSGEFLSKGMFMIRGQKNYIRNVPLRIAIGVVEGKEGLVVGGPVSAINSYAKNRVELVPGRQSSGKIAKIVRSSLVASATKELREKILKLKIEEIQRFIPSGKSEITKR